jgi:deazaflavin-dependent oxidoreductase (nitroreductase family)
MTSAKTNGLYRTIRRLAAMPASSAILSRSLHHLDRFVLRLTGGRYTAASLLTGLPVVTLTTVGARSGKLRTHPLLGIVDGEDVVLIASNFGRSRHPAWYFNLRANPECTVTVRGETKSYVAREVTGAEREKYWRMAVELYPGYDAYQQRTGGRRIPVLVLTPKRS